MWVLHFCFSWVEFSRTNYFFFCFNFTSEFVFFFAFNLIFKPLTHYFVLYFAISFKILFIYFCLTFKNHFFSNFSVVDFFFLLNFFYFAEENKVTSLLPYFHFLLSLPLLGQYLSGFFVIRLFKVYHSGLGRIQTFLFD